MILMLMTTLMASEATDNYTDDDNIVGLLGQPSHASGSSKDMKMGVPLYRVRSRPNYFIPASKLNGEDQDKEEKEKEKREKEKQKKQERDRKEKDKKEKEKEREKKRDEKEKNRKQKDESEDA